MSERPEEAVVPPPRPVRWPAWRPDDSTPWAKSLWGTTIDYGNGQKLVIDKNGVGTWTDAAGETGTWDPDVLSWVDDDGSLKDSAFGIPGTEMTAEMVDDVIRGFEEEASIAGLSDPAQAQALRERAKALWERWHDVDAEPYPYE